jgi:phosphatidylglycerol:prolipoprotein diacylglycerol transferase
MQARRAIFTGWRAHDVDDMLFYGVFGVILGGRLGYVLFYRPMYYLEHPLEILAVWQGGMSFHGGLLGVLLALWLYSRRRGKRWLEVTDFVAPLVPLGLGAGRLGNFINGELWGRPTGSTWGMIFPHVDNVARHPSQLYEFALEGLLLFAILWTFASRPRPMGAVSGLFLVGYGVMRYVVEFVREPDAGIFDFPFGLTMGQTLSVPMIADRLRDDAVGVRACAKGAPDDPRPDEVGRGCGGAVERTTAPPLNAQVELTRRDESRCRSSPTRARRVSCARR